MICVTLVNRQAHRQRELLKFAQLRC